MNLERQLLHYLACRLRWARQDVRMIRRDGRGFVLLTEAMASNTEARNAFHGAKMIYNEGKK